MKKIFEEFYDIYLKKNKEYGDQHTKLEYLFDVILDGKKLVLDSGKDVADFHFSMEILVKFLRYFNIRFLNKDIVNSEDSLKDLTIYAAMVYKNLDKNLDEEFEGEDY